MLYSIERSGRFPAAVTRIRGVESGPSPDYNINGDVTAGGAGRVYAEDVDLVRRCTDIPGVHQPEEHSILYVWIAGENIEEAGGGGAEVNRKEASKITKG